MAQSGIERAIHEAGGEVAGIKAIAELLGVTPNAIYKFRRKGWFPTDRARRVSEVYGIPLADLVRSDVRAALLNA